MKNECLSPVSHIRRAWSSAAKARPAIRRAARRRAGQHMTGQLQGAAKGSDATGTGQGDGPATRHATRERTDREPAQEKTAPPQGRGRTPHRHGRTSRPRALRQELEPGIVHRDLPARAGFQPGPDAGMGGGPYPVLLLHHAGIGLTQQHLGRHGTVIGACQPEGELQRQAAGGIPRLQGLADGGQPLAQHTAGSSRPPSLRT